MSSTATQNTSQHTQMSPAQPHIYNLGANTDSGNKEEKKIWQQDGRFTKRYADRFSLVSSSRPLVHLSVG